MKVKDTFIEIQEENERLNARIIFLEKCVEALKLNNSKLTVERNNAITELDKIKSMSMFEFSTNYCTAEQQEADGRAFAKALLGGK